MLRQALRRGRLDNRGDTTMRETYYQMRHELRLLRRCHRNRKSETATYRRRLWLGERVLTYIRRLPASGAMLLH